MAHDHDNHDDTISRRHVLQSVTLASTGLLWTVLGGAPESLRPLGQAEAATASAQTKPTIPIIVKDTTSSYWQIALAGARKAGQDLGVNVIELGAQSESDIDGQISILSAVAANPAAVVIAPSQFTALGKPIDEAAKKIKIIGIDSTADSKALTSLLTTDNEQAGRIAADILADAIKRTYADAEGDVALITSLPGATSLDPRANGFRQQIAAKYGALDIVAEKVGDSKAATAAKIMTDLIAEYPELRGVFASNLVMAQGAAQVLVESKTNKTGDKINLVGFDSDVTLLRFLQDDTIAALVVQDPLRMGYDGIKTALAASRGEQVPAYLGIDANLITKANMNSARSQELLNPRIK
jgi:ribose transport system substrate-binding protein